MGLGRKNLEREEEAGEWRIGEGIERGGLDERGGGKGIGERTVR